MSEYLILGNWKMNGSLATNESLLEQFAAAEIKQGITAGVCAPYVYLPQLQSHLQASSFKWGAQDMSIHKQGAYTGEISGSMLQDFSCSYVLVGHSERREYHGESDQQVAQKSLAVLQHNMIPVICVGETLEQREANETLAIIDAQLTAVKKVLNDEQLGRAVIAYEPVWAIGTGLTATPEQAQEVHAFIRQNLGPNAGSIKILYGGSMNENNAADLLAQQDIDGGLVGGASLKPESFLSIIQQAS